MPHIAGNHSHWNSGNEREVVMEYIYYESKTGNVQRFIEKLENLRDWKFIKINDETIVEKSGHFITYTTNFGEIPKLSEQFLNNNHEEILSVSSSGNMNWGKLYALAADKINEKYGIPVFIKFELAGLNSDADIFIKKVEEI